MLRPEPIRSRSEATPVYSTMQSDETKIGVVLMGSDGSSLSLQQLFHCAQISSPLPRRRRRAVSFNERSVSVELSKVGPERLQAEHKMAADLIKACHICLVTFVQGDVVSMVSAGIQAKRMKVLFPHLGVAVIGQHVLCPVSGPFKEDEEGCARAAVVYEEQEGRKGCSFYEVCGGTANVQQLLCSWASDICFGKQRRSSMEPVFEGKD